MSKRKEQTRKAQPKTDVKSTGTNPVAGSRSRTVERQKEREQQQRRQRLMIAGVVIGVLAIMAVISIIINSTPAAAPIPEGAVERYSGVTATITDQGYPRLGNSDTARVRMIEYSSFSCPSCRAFHEEVFSTILDRVKTNEITFTYVPLDGFGSAGSTEAANAALCVAEQDPIRFWSFHDALFDWLDDFGNQSFTLNRLRTGVEALGLNVDAYNSCMNSGRKQAIIDQAVAEAEALNGFAGTPHVTINGVNLTSLTVAGLNTEIDNQLAIFNANQQPEPTATEEIVATQEVTATEEITATEETSATAEATP